MCYFRHGGEKGGDLLVTKNGEKQGNEIIRPEGEKGGVIFKTKIGEKDGICYFRHGGERSGGSRFSSQRGKMRVVQHN